VLSVILNYAEFLFLNANLKVDLHTIYKVIIDDYDNQVWLRRNKEKEEGVKVATT